MKLIHRTRWGAALAVAVLVMAGATSAQATLAPGTLNAADGNLVVNGSEIDWATLASAGDIVCPNAPGGTGAVGCSLDLLQGQGDNAFGQGTKEDTAVPTVVDDSIPPNKSDLTRFYIAIKTVNGKDYAYLAWERIQDPSGTTNMDFEINKSGTLSSNGETPVRSVGDVLITYDLAQGGTTPVLAWRSWTGSQWGPVQSLAGNFEGSVNNPGNNPPDGRVIDPINPGAPRTLDAFTFGEASVNLTDSGIVPANSCASFSAAYLKSRSSDSFTAALKDFVSPTPIRFNKCGQITIVKNTVGGNGTFGWTTSANLGLAGNTFSLATVGNTASRTFSSLFAGTYTFNETSLPNGWTLTGLVCANDDPNKPASTFSTSGALATVNLVAQGAVTCTYTNTAKGAISIHKQDDDDPAVGLAGAVFTLYNDAAPIGGTRGAEDTSTGVTCTTDASGNCSFTNILAGTYWVVETTTPAGHDTAADQAVTLGAGATVPLTFTDPRNFKVIVLVCKEADNSLYSSSVTLDQEGTKNSLSSAPAGLTSEQLCSLGGASFGGLSYGLYDESSVNIPQ